MTLEVSSAQFNATDLTDRSHPRRTHCRQPQQPLVQRREPGSADVAPIVLGVKSGTPPSKRSAPFAGCCVQRDLDRTGRGAASGRVHRFGVPDDRTDVFLGCDGVVPVLLAYESVRNLLRFW